MTTDVTTGTDYHATITAIVATELKVPADSLASDTDLREVEGADSIKVLRMIAKIEQTYDVELEDEDIFAVHTVDEVVALVTAAVARDHG